MLRWYTYCEWIGSLDYNGEDIERGPGDKEDSREEGQKDICSSPSLGVSDDIGGGAGQCDFLG